VIQISGQLKKCNEMYVYYMKNNTDALPDVFELSRSLYQDLYFPLFRFLPEPPHGCEKDGGDRGPPGGGLANNARGCQLAIRI